MTTLYCNFCGKSQHEVAPMVYICDACVDLCHAIAHPPDAATTDKQPIPPPLDEGLRLAKIAIETLCDLCDWMREHQKHWTTPEDED
jgi:hypothetical protein